MPSLQTSFGIRYSQMTDPVEPSDPGTWKYMVQPKSTKSAGCVHRFLWNLKIQLTTFLRKFQLLPCKKPRSMQELFFSNSLEIRYFCYRNLNFNVLVNFILFHPLAIYIYITYLLFILWTHYHRLTYGIAWLPMFSPKAGCLLSSSTVLVFSGYQLSQAFFPGGVDGLNCGRFPG